MFWYRPFVLTITRVIKLPVGMSATPAKVLSNVRGCAPKCFKNMAPVTRRPATLLLVDAEYTDLRP